jgi:hypothetical protein
MVFQITRDDLFNVQRDEIRDRSNRLKWRSHDGISRSVGEHEASP